MSSAADDPMTAPSIAVRNDEVPPHATGRGLSDPSDDHRLPSPPRSGPWNEQEHDTAPTEEGSANQPKHWLRRVGETLFHGMEFVGEIVASVLGIDESKYQDIYDSMTEEELAEARRVNDIRNAEYEAWIATQPPSALEGHECGHVSSGDVESTEAPAASGVELVTCPPSVDGLPPAPQNHSLPPVGAQHVDTRQDRELATGYTTQGAGGVVDVV